MSTYLRAQLFSHVKAEKIFVDHTVKLPYVQKAEDDYFEGMSQSMLF